MTGDSISQDSRKRALEALERRCAIAKAELLQQQKKIKTKEELIKADAGEVTLNSSSLLKKSFNPPILLPSEKPSNRDKEESGPVYSTLSSDVNEKLLASNTNFSERQGNVTAKIFHELLHNGGSAQKYVQGLKALKDDNWVLLDNFVSGRSALTGSHIRALRSNSKRSKRHMSMKQHKKSGSLDLSPDLHKFEIFELMHEMWKSYMACRIGNAREDVLAKNLLIADLHGAIILVVDCKINSFTGTSGIMIRETAETFGIVTRDDKFRVVPKKPSVFVFQYDCWKVTLHGDKLTSRIPSLPS